MHSSTSSALMHPFPPAPTTALEYTLWAYALDHKIGRYWKHYANVERVTQQIMSAKLAGQTRVAVPRELELSVNIACAQLALTYKLLEGDPAQLEIDLTHFDGPPMISSGVPATPAKPEDTAPAQSDAPPTCVICLDRPKTILCLPCRHVCLCQACAQIIETMDAPRRRCPMCRAEIVSMLHVFY